MTNSPRFTGSCPTAIAEHSRVLLAHGGGGRLMRTLIQDLIIPGFATEHSEQPAATLHDGAVLDLAGARIAFTTDSYVVRPCVFPGGDIGSLAVHGTINDLAMCGARPVWMSAGFILEEGLPMAALGRVVESMRSAAAQTGVQIATGDTKVVDRGHGDGIFINTAGIGLIEHELAIGPAGIEPGDAVILNGDLGRHGIAVMSVREGLEFEATIESDSASLWDLVDTLLREEIAIHCLRDLTRGGLTSALVELAEDAGTGITIDERSIPVREDVRGACELLGLDPLCVANEGRCLVFVPESDAGRALDLIKSRPLGQGAARIGTAQGTPGRVVLRSAIGVDRLLDMLSGEQLPRIC